MMPELVTLEDVAARLQLDSRSVQRLIESGDLAAVVIDDKLRIFGASVDDFLVQAYSTALDEAAKRRGKRS
jgi:hypothetical protein